MNSMILTNINDLYGWNVNIPYKFESLSGIIFASVAAAVRSVTVPITEVAVPGDKARI